MTTHFIDKTGEVNNSNYCGPMEIIEYFNCMNIKVKFKTGSIVNSQYSQFKRGTIKDPMVPSVCAVGYIGVGVFKAKINGKTTIEYCLWKNMLRRCYDPNVWNRQPIYRDVTVCDEWLNFQKFAKWHQEHYVPIVGERVDLDKDLIKQNNKTYCPKFCSLVPHCINSLLIKSNKVQEFPIGVNCVNNKYIAKLHVNGKTKYIGSYATPIAAFNAYKIAKEKYIKIKANMYRQYISPILYMCLMTYKVKITD